MTVRFARVIHPILSTMPTTWRDRSKLSHVWDRASRSPAQKSMFSAKWDPS